MLRTAKSACFFVAFAVTSLTAVLEAQEPKDAAPVPAQIIAARKVFISNAGQENVPGALSGEPDRTYNQFYGAIKNWGQYELVSAPADADLVLEISFTIPSAGSNVFKGDSVGSAYAPEFRLRILDPKTHFTLWAFTEHVQFAMFAGNRDKKFDQGMANLVNDVKKVAGRSTSAVDAAKK